MIQVSACFFLICDGGGDCDPWEEGVLHFSSVEEALSYARSDGWLVAGDRAVCREHAAKADCESTGHQYGWWRPREMRGVSYQTRCCEHCGDTEYDPPFHELSLLVHAAREMGGDRG